MSEVTLNILWNDVVCSQHAYLTAQEELRKARLRVMDSTEKWVKAAKEAGPCVSTPVSNNTGEYLRVHADIEHEVAA